MKMHAVPTENYDILLKSLGTYPTVAKNPRPKSRRRVITAYVSRTCQYRKHTDEYFPLFDGNAVPVMLEAWQEIVDSKEPPDCLGGHNYSKHIWEVIFRWNALAVINSDGVPTIYGESTTGITYKYEVFDRFNFPKKATRRIRGRAWILQ